MASVLTTGRDRWAPVTACSWVFFPSAFLEGLKADRGLGNQCVFSLLAGCLQYSLRCGEVGASGPFTIQMGRLRQSVPCVAVRG